jgi:hypothetical protein
MYYVKKNVNACKYLLIFVFFQRHVITYLEVITAFLIDNHLINIYSKNLTDSYHKQVATQLTPLS